MIWENTDDCDEQYICTTTLYLLSVLDHEYNIIIEHASRAPGHGKYVVDILNTIGKIYQC